MLSTLLNLDSLQKLLSLFRENRRDMAIVLLSLSLGASVYACFILYRDKESINALYLKEMVTKDSIMLWQSLESRQADARHLEDVKMLWQNHFRTNEEVKNLYREMANKKTATISPETLPK